MSDTNREFIIIRETLAGSIARDAVSFGSLSAAVWLGVWMRSDALQWVAGIIWILFLLSSAYRYGNGKAVFTFADARKRLDELERMSPTSLNERTEE